MLQSLALRLISLFHLFLRQLPSVLSSHIYALLCLLHLGLNLPVSGPLQTTTLTLDILGRPLPTHVISTPNVPLTPRTRTVLIVHGLAPSAHDDPRILHLARAVAAAQPSALVLVPHIPPLATCDLADAPVALIEALVRTIPTRPDLCPSARLSIASPCISAGFCLVAASRAPQCVHAILTIGTHASVKSVMDHVILRQGKDDTRYAFNSLLASFLEPRTSLRDMLVAYVADDHYRNIGKPADELPRILAAHPDEAAVYHRLQEDPHYLEEQLRKTYHQNEDIFLEMSPVEHLDGLELEALILVHSQTDDIVPSNESVILRDALKGREDIQTELCVTSLLNHGDHKAIGLQDVPAILQLVAAFAGFFRPDKSLIKPKQKSA